MKYILASTYIMYYELVVCIHIIPALHSMYGSYLSIHTLLLVCIL